MHYLSYYKSPLGEIVLSASNQGLSGLWFVGQKYFTLYFDKEYIYQEIPLFADVKRWLDIYFSGKEPNFSLPLHFTGSTFQNEVWKILSQIPYGRTTTYVQIAKQVAIKRGVSKMSAQAIGGAVGRNKIAIIVPCHRVVGVNGNLTGYAGGIEKKIALLQLEGIDTTLQ